jgi:hypothetical protein
MKIKLTLGLLVILLLSCNDNKQNSFTQTTTENKVTFDTIVGSKAITNEISGSAYRKSATEYAVIIGKDTSDYTCVFTESKDGGKVNIILNIPYSKATMTYKQRLEELKIILPKAAKDYNFDSLHSISFGRLILSGDLAIDITQQYRQKFGTINKLENYTTFEEFLKGSKLVTDVNTLFNPYSLSVDKVSIEKLFFTTRQSLYWASKIETDTTNIPDKILDCMTWVTMSKKLN